jgi:hypothetical protein
MVGNNNDTKKQLNEIFAFSPIKNKNSLLINSRFSLPGESFKITRKEKGWFNADDSIDMFKKEFSRPNIEKEKVRKGSLRDKFYK